MIKELPDPTKESAMERASRIWQNAKIQRKYAISDNIKVDLNKVEKEYDERRMNSTLARFSAEVKEIVNSNNQNMIKQYLATIRHKKYKLLKEKLRRLKESTDGQL